MSSSSRMVQWLLVAILAVVVLVAGPCGQMAEGQSNCQPSYIDRYKVPLLMCQPYIMNGNDTVPGEQCCTAVNDTTGLGECFCTFYSQMVTLSQSQSNVNRTRANDLYTLCSIQPPPELATCSIGAPSSAPSVQAPSLNTPAIKNDTNSPGPNSSNSGLYMTPSFVMVSIFLIASSLYI